MADRHDPLEKYPLARRELLQRTALGLAALPLVSACGEGVGLPDVGAGADAGSGGTDAGSSDLGNPDAGNPDAGVMESWAMGGTAAMTDKANYPDPFTGQPNVCALVPVTTAGPCTTAEDLSREDVSEGRGGLPVRLGLKVVNTACSPVAGAIVKIWHTTIDGSYTGQTPNNAFCVLDPALAAVNAFRGVRETDSEGVVYFDTCFPGWYPGRAIHIHFEVLDANSSYRISQLFFPEDITEDIFENHPEYSPFGFPDTGFANDGVISRIPGGELEPLILDVARMSDGAMLASKVLTVI